MANNEFYTVPNQRTVCVHRIKAESNFLGINNDTWMAAARDLGAHATLLYLYFASNRDKYTFALSPEAIRKEIGMPRSTYRDQFNKLIDKGYVVHSGGNRYDFYECPVRVTQAQENGTTSVNGNENCTATVFACTGTDEKGTAKGIEINNKYDLPNQMTNNSYPKAWGEKCAWDIGAF